jgi:gliding-associated putative ABC transporter substrate-binding component GldG
MNKKNLWINLIIFIAIIIFVNLVSLNIFHRFDFSRGQIYSLSEASKNSVKNLDDRIVVKAYFSENLPSQYADLRRFVEDTLAEYEAYGRNNFKFEFIDPTDENDLKAEAQKNRIQPATMRVNENDQLVIREVYMGLAFLYQDKVEAIPIVQNSQGLEYDITSKINLLTQAERKKIGFFAPDDIPQDPRYGRAGKYDTIKHLISESYELQSVDLQTEISDLSVLLISGVREDLSDEQLRMLDKFVMNDGKVLILQDRVLANLQEQTADLIDSNLFDLLQHYGIKIKENLVADAKCGQVQMQRRQGLFSMNTPVDYPFLPIVTDLNSSQIITKNIDLVQNIFVSELDTLQTKLVATPLFFSSDNSSEATAPNFDIAINKYIQADLRSMLLDGKKTLAALYSGKFSSYYFEENRAESFAAEIVLVADGDFAVNGAGAGAQGNLDFVMNSLDYLAGESGLIEMRSRGTSYRPLKELNSSQKKIVKYLNIILPALLLILLGIILYRRELSKRKMIGEIYE